MRSRSQCKRALHAALFSGILVSHAFTTAMAATLYVDLLNTTPVAPYTNWLTAATSIQDAVDAANSDDRIMVNDGVYQTGSGTAPGITMANRVAVVKPVTIQSVNGPAVTAIDGRGAVRCAYLTNGAVLDGFMLTNGVTPGNGGGVCCESTNAILLNCTLAANVSSNAGGGAYSGTLSNCTLIWNRAAHGCGAESALLQRCTVTGNSTILKWFGRGGGLENCFATDCTVTGNSSYYGAGAYGGTLNHCVLSGNDAVGAGGGAHTSVLESCTVRGNQGRSWPGGGGGVKSSTAINCIITGNSGVSAAGADSSTLVNCTILGNVGHYGLGGVNACALTNCIVYDNTAPYGSDPSTDNYGASSLSHCCTTPLPANGEGNITNAPAFADQPNGDFHLRFDSPCLNSGDSAAVTTPEDLDGSSRIVGEAVDMGPYEFQIAPPAILADFISLLPQVAATFTAFVSPEYATNLFWDFGDGTYATNNLTIAHSWATAGDYLVVFRAYSRSDPGGVSATARVHVAAQVVSYVDAAGTNPIAPFYSWENAATNIQDAVDVVMPSPESLVLVTNGIYQTGGRRTRDGISNRVAVTRPVTLRSVNGPQATVIDGGNTLRCVYLTNAAVLAGFGVRNGHADNGAGVWCASNDVVISGCEILANTATGNGGGAYGGTLQSCAIAQNLAKGAGGGAFGSTLNNCTLVGNSTGASSATLTNCIVYFSKGNNTDGSTLSHCCTTPDPGGTANVTAEPQMTDFAHIAAGSPCRGAADPAFTRGMDIDGEAWTNPPSIGCDEYYTGPTGALKVTVEAAYTNVARGFTVNLSAQIEGHARRNLWDLGDGTTTSNRLYYSHSWQTPGDYAVTVTAYNDTFPAGVTASIVIHVTGETHYVDVNGANPVPPYTSWATAATNIQAALDMVKAPGALVLVTNGIYQTGGRIVSGVLSNRVVVTKPLVLQSVNGPTSTVIQGYKVPGTTFGDSAVRCVYLADGASLIGFTLTNGATRAAGDIFNEQSGGGLFCSSTACIVSNCLLIANAAYAPTDLYGTGGGGAGGVLRGTLYACRLVGNSAPNGNGGGAFSSVLSDCILTGNSAGYGGGAYQSALTRCWITNNTAGQGGGIYCTTFDAAANNCVLTGNRAGLGGASYGGGLFHCTIVSNTASSQGGGAWNSAGMNSILFYNTAPKGPDVYTGGYLYCCTVPAYDIGAFSDPPLFVDLPGGNLHLNTNSPCVNSGNNEFPNQSTDFEGKPRCIAQKVDIGAYELQAAQPPTAYVKTDYTNLIVGFTATFNAGYLWGRATSATWDFGDGTIVSNTLSPSHSWTTPGDYPVVAQVSAPNNPTGLTAMISVHVTTQIVHYVSASATNPIPPFSSWATAATNIQDAVDVATPWPGSLVIVTNGLYQYGGRVVHGAMSNRLAVTKPIQVQSVNGPESTIIQGYQVPGAVHGNSAIRCVYLTNGAVITGFTLQGGATRMAGDSNQEQSGAGVWCASTNAMVTNCVLTGNRALWSGGGAYGGTLFNCLLSSNQVTYKAGGAAEGANCSNCTFVDNSSGLDGGGVDQCTLYACELSENTAYSNGGAASSSRLNNCTVTGNSAGAAGGGSYNGTLTNCIVSYNRAPSGSNYFGGTLIYCCAQPLAAGTGNFSEDPQLTDRMHIAATSPCRGAGTALPSAGSDIDGEPWLPTPSVGCDEYYAGSATGPLEVTIHADYTNVGAGFAVGLAGVISGHANLSVWDLGSGTLLTNQPNLLRSWVTAGDYPVTLTAYNGTQPGGVSATVTVHVVTQPVHYVSLTSANPVAPFLSWSTAATNVQDAADAAFPGGTVRVTNGVYSLGGRVVFGLLTNRLAVSRPVVIQSVNGAAATVIQGNAVAGDSAVRCAYLGEGASLIGFTLTAGATRTAGDLVKEQSGGGIWCWSSNCLVSNCVITSNSASRYGGGAFAGSLSYCTLSANSATSGGGACSNTLNACTLTANKASNSGGGAYGSTLNTCLFASNTNTSSGGAIHSCVATGCAISNNVSTSGSGGGAYNCSLTNCSILNNTARQGGGGAYNSVITWCRLSGNLTSSGYGGAGYGGTFNNCLISSNSAPAGGATFNSTLNSCTLVGHTNNYAAYSCTARNCIIYYNFSNWGGSALTNCCTTPLPSGLANFTNAPAFVDLQRGNFRLQTNSPCINSGNNLYVTTPTDLDGRPRITARTVDMGAYEFQGPGAGEFIAWLQQNGLTTDSSADFKDSDGDGMNNWQEWVADTTPTNGLSSLLVLRSSLATLGVNVSWQSTANRNYLVERSTNLAVHPTFAILASNVPGQAGMTTYTDTTATGPGPFFYRVGVQAPTAFWQAPLSQISFAWLQQYEFLTDGSADIIDPDADSMNNWQEWIAGTNPTNASSILVLLAPATNTVGLKVTWQSVIGKTYYLQRSTNLSFWPTLSSLQSNIVGRIGTTTFTDTSATNAGPYFYRVGVQ